MRQTQRISLDVIQGPDEDKPPKSKLLIDGRHWGVTVFGCLLEAALEGDNFYILFLTDNCPFEEFLSILMLDRSGNTVDSCSLGLIYSTGTFSALRVIDKNHASFRFIGDTTWTLEVFPTAKLRMPLVSEPFCVWRKNWFRSNFRLHGYPKPETAFN